MPTAGSHLFSVFVDSGSEPRARRVPCWRHTSVYDAAESTVAAAQAGYSRHVGLTPCWIGVIIR